MANIQVEDILAGTPAVQCKTRCVFRFPRRPPRSRRAGNDIEIRETDDPPRASQIVCTLGPKSAELSIMEDLLRAGMSVARFNFSHGSHDYHQGTLDTLRQAMAEHAPDVRGAAGHEGP